MRTIAPFSKDLLESILEGLPLDITIIDDQDRIVAWTSDRRSLFGIEEELMGTDVRECHPQKSHHILDGMLTDMRSGKLDSTCSVKYVTKGGVERRFMIKYVALRDRIGRYLGCMEVDMDLTDIPEPEERSGSY